MTKLFTQPNKKVDFLAKITYSSLMKPNPPPPPHTPKKALRLRLFEKKCFILLKIKENKKKKI